MKYLNRIIVVGAIVLGQLLFYITCLNHVSVGEVGVAYNSGNGEVTLQQPGWHVTYPLVRATTLPTTPFWVSVYTTATIRPRRLVRFVPEHLDEFIRVQGFSYYNSGGGWESSDGAGAVQRLFAGYAFSGREYPFLEIVE